MKDWKIGLYGSRVSLEYLGASRVQGLKGSGTQGFRDSRVQGMEEWRNGAPNNFPE